MDRSRASTGLGIILVALGCLFLLQNFGFLSGLGNLFWALLVGAGGLAFLGVFISNREQWWALIPSFTLLGLASTLALSDTSLAGGWVGAIFLGAIGAAFLVIYLLRREYWWALIPAGALFTLALVSAASSVLPGEASGGILFLGLAATFGSLYMLPAPIGDPRQGSGDPEREPGRQQWALIPAGVLALLGILMIASSGALIGLIVPVALIVAGGYVVLRGLGREQRV